MSAGKFTEDLARSLKGGTSESESAEWTALLNTYIGLENSTVFESFIDIALDGVAEFENEYNSQVKQSRAEGMELMREFVRKCPSEELVKPEQITEFVKTYAEGFKADPDDPLLARMIQIVDGMVWARKDFATPSLYGALQEIKEYPMFNATARYEAEQTMGSIEHIQDGDYGFSRITPPEKTVPKVLAAAAKECATRGNGWECAKKGQPFSDEKKNISVELSKTSGPDWVALGEQRPLDMPSKQKFEDYRK